MWCGINSDEFVTWPRDTPDPFITHMKNLLKFGTVKSIFFKIRVFLAVTGWGRKKKSIRFLVWFLFNAPSKTSIRIFCQAPTLKSANCPSLLFRQSPLYIGFSWTPPLKVGFFNERPKYQSVSSLTPSYLLKVTNFLVKISQFEFLVITEKNIFVYKLFMSLNISDFSLFFWKFAPPPLPLKKVTPLIPSNFPSQRWGPFRPPP